MESSDKLELLDRAIQKIIAGEDNRGKEAAGGENEKDRELLLSELLSEIERLKGESVTEEEAGDSGEKEYDDSKVGAEEIAKELRKVRRQNVVTHCLLSVMIVLTVAWQLSEVSLILKLKDGLSHPFRSFGSMLTGLVKGPATTALDGEKNHKQSSSQQQQDAGTSPASPLKLLELPRT